jgi:hypothetical protein
VCIPAGTSVYLGIGTYRHISALTSFFWGVRRVQAGNLNFAVLEGGTSGDYVLIFDSDMQARPEILQVSCPWRS